jgi:hypothetical protein
MATLLPPGIAELLIPFVLTFALSFGVLTISGVFKGQKQVNFVIALALGALAVSSPGYAAMLTEWSPILATVLIVVFVLMFLKNTLLSKEGLGGNWENLVAIALLFLVLITIGPSLPLPSGSFIKSDDIMIAGGAVLIIAIIVIVMSLGNKDFEGK